MNPPAIAPGIGARRWWALGAVMLAVLAVGLDATVLSVALPTLAAQLHASESDLQWFSSGYLLVLAALMLPAGLLGDRFGRKRVMLGALLLFGLASAGCADLPDLRGVPRGADPARVRRGAPDRDGDVRPGRALHPGGAAQGGGDLGGGQLRRASRSGPSWAATSSATPGGAGCS